MRTQPNQGWVHALCASASMLAPKKADLNLARLSTKAIPDQADESWDLRYSLPARLGIELGSSQVSRYCVGKSKMNMCITVPSNINGARDPVTRM